MKVPMNQSLPWPILETEAREQLRRAEPKRAKRARRARRARARARMASDAPQEAIPDRTESTAAQGADWRGPAHSQAPPEALTAAQETERERSTAQGAGGMGPAHGQAPPEAAQGVQRSQSSQVLSFTRTSADLFNSMADETAEAQSTSADLVGSMADKSERELSTVQGAGGMGPAHGQAPPKAAQGVQRSQNAQVLSLTHTSADLFNSTADKTKREISTAFRALGNYFRDQALNCTGKKKRKKSGCLSLPRPDDHAAGARYSRKRRGLTPPFASSKTSS
jgi:hypothetical protein